MGTDLNQDKVFDIRSAYLGFTILLCLDRDATTKAASHAERFKLWIDMKVVPLSRDLKYLSDSELEEILS